MTDLTVAHTILAQLGGRQFTLMTGARDFVGSSDSLIFRIPRSNGITLVRITLDASDTYTVKFGRMRGVDFVTASETSGVYFDQLQSVFTDATGLLTSLGTMGAK